MPAENSPATRIARAEITRRNIDSSMLEVRVLGSVCYMSGVVGNLRTHPDLNIKKEMEIITHSLRGKSGIRDVVWDCTIRGASA